MNEIDMILDVLLKASIIGIGWSAIVVLAKLMSNDIDRIRREYEARIKELREQVNEYRERIEELKARHREELRRYSKVSRMLMELKKAIDNGAVKVVCPRHPDSEITILADGTMVCSKGHRVWPPEEGEGEGGET